MLEVRVNRRPDLFQQALQFRILGARDQRLVDRIQHGLVVGDFIAYVT